MKRVLSILLALTMILSLSVSAFAAGSPSSGGVDEPEVYDVPGYVPVVVRTDRDVEIRKVPMPKGVTVDDSHVIVDRLADAPEEIKAIARQVIDKMNADGYTIDSSFASWCDDGKVTRCISKIPVSSVPEGYDIYVNGVLVEDSEMHDGFYFVEVDLPAIITIARK